MYIFLHIYENIDNMQEQQDEGNGFGLVNKESKCWQ